MPRELISEIVNGERIERGFVGGGDPSLGRIWLRRSGACGWRNLVQSPINALGTSRHFSDIYAPACPPSFVFHPALLAEQDLHILVSAYSILQ
jgi:hypothetical protein